MPETKYNVEIQFKDKEKYQYVAQTNSLEWAIRLALKPYYYNHGKVRVRKVVKTIVWKSKSKEEPK